ncbi:hypothetical protein RR46_07417 [Papilio xuthus]|uniref:Kazal-like domain-containing protein n=1 Tax=Papilio xuthus TaxID=66420 RepID=A0A194Q2N6_PAPXU|nr:hypothetical protein RR46_07417 [Papilio xuthus]
MGKRKKKKLPEEVFEESTEEEEVDTSTDEDSEKEQRKYKPYFVSDYSRRYPEDSVLVQMYKAFPILRDVFILIFKEATALRSQKIRPSDDTIEQIESLKERILATDNLRPKSLAAEQDPELSFRIGLGMLSPLPIDVDDELLKNIDSQKAFACSQLQCSRQETSTPVCACNYKSGNVVTFKNDCDAKKHNCRFNTGRTHPNISLTNLKWS